MLQRATNYFDDLFLRLNGGGVSLPVAVERVAGAYLDGKPLPVGKRKLTKKDRDSLFWSSNVVKKCPPDSWNAEAMVLALARYLGQEPFGAEELVTRVAREAPDALTSAVRYSALVLNSHSPRRGEAQLRLREAYGVADEVTSESGESVNLFQALLSLDLMSAFFQRDFLAAFAERLDASGNWIVALRCLTMDGLREGFQNRLPLTWSDRDSKVTNITGWTVTASEPKGNPRMASAILDFWTYDMVAMAERLQRSELGLQPQLFEIATLGQHLFVIEVKSTFLRRSQREAWLHATSTIRKAGHQLRRKVEAVSRAIASDPELRALLDLNEDRIPTRHHGWIADTSIECDHQRFAGFLKVSVEDLLMVLRNDRHLLNDPEGLLAGNDRADQSLEADTSRSAWTLYPHGFSAERFIEVIETEAVWDLRDRTHPFAKSIGIVTVKKSVKK